MYLNKYSKCVEKTSQFSYYPVVEIELEHDVEIDRSFIVKHRQKKHYITEWYLCETFVLDDFLEEWWGVASRAQKGQPIIGQANTTILTGDKGSIRWKYDWFFQTLTISAIVSPNLDLKCVHDLDRVDAYRLYDTDLLALPYNKFFIYKGAICRVIHVESFYRPTSVKQGLVVGRQGYTHVTCIPVACLTPMLMTAEVKLTVREIEDLLDRKERFLSTRDKILSNLADPFQLIHVTPIPDPDDDKDVHVEKMAALWNVDRPLNKAGERLYDVVCRLTLEDALTKDKLFEELNYSVYSKDAFLSNCSNFKIDVPKEVSESNKSQVLQWICSYVVDKYNTLCTLPDVDAGTNVPPAVVDPFYETFGEDGLQDTIDTFVF
jgi:hypothetical protein